MTKQQKQRLAVARDVIAQTRLDTYKVTPGIYVEHDEVKERNIGSELQTILKKGLSSEQPCEVCAMGACFISTIRLYDDFKLRDNSFQWGQIDPSKLKAKVSQIFTRREMGVLESCFEQSGGWLKTKADRAAFGGGDDSDTDGKVFREFLNDLSPDARLIFLMEVVIENPKQQVTVQIVKDTFLRFLLAGRYAENRAQLGL